MTQTTGASRAAKMFDERTKAHTAQPPMFERGVITGDGRLMPDTWGGDPFYPKDVAPTGIIGYERAWHMAEGQFGELALVGMVITDTNDSGVAGTWNVEHQHPTRPLQPGDRVLLVWARGVPVVVLVLA